MAAQPSQRPSCPDFGSGPTRKHAGWTLESLAPALVGRSHRSGPAKVKLLKAIEDTKRILGVPEGYAAAIVPASDTGAFEMAMWSLLGPLPVDVLSWESFGKGWYDDIKGQLKLKDLHGYEADYGLLPDLSQADFSHDVVFAWNGTTSGVRVPNGDWIPNDRKGLTLCDATSAVFGMDLPWEKLDVVTFSWQKCLGGEAAHGMIILSPRALQRLEEYKPAWPMPKLFRMTKGGKVNEELFKGEVINTVSMLCVEDYLEALAWAESVGGVAGLIARSQKSLEHVTKFVEQHDWISFLAQDPAARSSTSVCLNIALPQDKVKEIQTLLQKNGVAYDIGSYRTAPAGLRLWCAGNVEPDDVALLLPWIEWAHNQVTAAQ